MPPLPIAPDSSSHVSSATAGIRTYPQSSAAIGPKTSFLRRLTDSTVQRLNDLTSHRFTPTHRSNASNAFNVLVALSSFVIRHSDSARSLSLGRGLGEGEFALSGPSNHQLPCRANLPRRSQTKAGARRRRANHQRFCPRFQSPSVAFNRFQSLLRKCCPCRMQYRESSIQQPASFHHSAFPPFQRRDGCQITFLRPAAKRSNGRLLDRG